MSMQEIQEIKERAYRNLEKGFSDININKIESDFFVISECAKTKYQKYIISKLRDIALLNARGNLSDFDAVELSRIIVASLGISSLALEYAHARLSKAV